MPCATQIHSSTIVGSTPVTLTARATKRLLKQTRYEEPAKESELKRHLDGINLNVISDCERADPECVWGDEGRLND
jgi:hypothetical protein